MFEDLFTCGGSGDKISQIRNMILDILDDDTFQHEDDSERKMRISYNIQTVIMEHSVFLNFNALYLSFDVVKVGVKFELSARNHQTRSLFDKIFNRII